MRSLHPSEAGMIRFFEYSHLPPKLQTISEPFAALANKVIDLCPPGPETTTALRKLLEAKDCAVRAAL